MLRYLVHRCWVSEFQALPDLDAGGNAIAIEHIKLENEGWERDLTLAEPAENVTLLPVSGVDAGRARADRCRTSSSSSRPALAPLPAAARAGASGGERRRRGPARLGRPARDRPRCRRAHDPAGLDRRRDPHRRQLPRPGLPGADRREFRHRRTISSTIGRGGRAASPKRPTRAGSRLAGAAVRFRIPTVADLLVAADARLCRRRPSADRCIDAPEMSAGTRPAPGPRSVLPSRPASTISSAGTAPRAGRT